MKKGSYSQEKSRGGGGGGEDFQKSQEKQGEISETQITFFVVCRNLYFRDKSGIFLSFLNFWNHDACT